MNLRRDDICSACAAQIDAGTKAWWHADQRVVTCTQCGPDSTPDLGCATEVSACPTAEAPPQPAWAPPAPIEVGAGGVSAQREYERRKAKHEQQIEAKWGTGRIGRFAKFMSDEPQSTVAWSKGSDGERLLAERLNRELDGVGIVLHDRKVPGTRGNIDHIAIAPSGVWVIDAKNYDGKVEVRDVGGWFTTDLRLYVNNRDRSSMAGGLDWQIEKVRAALEPIGLQDDPINPVLCFTNSEWGMFAKSIQFRGVLTTWPAHLIGQIVAPGELDERTVHTLAHQLSTALPAAR